MLEYTDLRISVYPSRSFSDEIFLGDIRRSEEHTSELQSHSFISYAVFCLKKKIITFFQGYIDREEENKEYANIVLLNKTGKELVNLDGIPNSLCNDPENFVKLKNSALPQIIFHTETSDNFFEYLCLNLPIFIEQEFRGILRIKFDIDLLFKDLHGIITGEIDHVHILTVSGINLIGEWDDSHNELFARTIEAVKTDPSGNGTASETGHGPSIYAYQKIDSEQVKKMLRSDDQLIVLLYRSEKNGLRPINTLINEVVFIWLGLFLVISVGLNHYTKKFIRPLEELKQGVENISLGNLDTPKLVKVVAKDEIGVLADSFNIMVSALHMTLVSRDYLDAVFSAMGDMVFVTDLEGQITRVNSLLTKYLDYDEQELMGKPGRAIIEGSTIYQEKNIDLAGLKEKVVREEVALISKNGEKIGTHLSSSLIKGAGEKENYIGIVNVGRDLRKFKMMIEALEEQRQALQSSAAKYRGLIEDSPLATAICQEGKIVYGNPAFNKFTQMSAETYQKLDFLELLPQEKRDEIKQLKEQWLASDNKAPYFSEVEIDLPHRGHRYVDLVAKPIEYEMRPAVLFVINDITEKNELQQRIFQGEKMSIVGTLASGVAHEFNNIIGGILGYAELAQSDPNYLDKLIEVVFSQGERVRLITQGLLSFSRRREEDEELINLSQLLNEVVILIERSLTKVGIKLEKKYPEYFEAFLSPGKLQLAVLNVILNAKEAIDEKGDIEVDLSKDEKNIFIVIKDTGDGIAPENLEKIFDPFFSTKGVWGQGVGSGMGLGLTHAQNLVKSMGGEIRVESQPQDGSKFTIVLPIKEDQRKEWIT